MADGFLPKTPFDRANFTFKKSEAAFLMPEAPDLTAGPPTFTNGKWRTEAVTDLVFSKNWRTLAKASVALIIPSAPRLPVGMSVPVNIVVSIRSKSFEKKPTEAPLLPDVDERALRLGLHSTHTSYVSAKYQFYGEPSTLVLDLWNPSGTASAATVERKVWRNEATWHPRSPRNQDKTGFFEKITIWTLSFAPDLLPSFDAVHGRLSVRLSFPFDCSSNLKLDADDFGTLNSVRAQAERPVRQTFAKGQGVYHLRVRQRSHDTFTYTRGGVVKGHKSQVKLTTVSLMYTMGDQGGRNVSRVRLSGLEPKGCGWVCLVVQ